MSTKVGSAGPTVESVIQYQNNASKSAENTVKKIEPVKLRKVSMHSSEDRKIKASENAKPAVIFDKKDVQSLAANPKDAVSAQKLEQADGNESVVEKPIMELSEEAIKVTVDDVNKKLQSTNASVEFSYHEKTGRYSFKLLDRETGETIREVPPEKSLDMVAKMFEMVGILVDEKL